MQFDPWIFLSAVFPAAVVTATASLCYAIASDASARDASGSKWGIFAIVLPAVAVPAYAVYRFRLPPRAESPAKLERWAGAYGVGAVLAILVGSAVTPPDPFSLVLAVVPLICVLVPATLVLDYEPGWRALVR